MARYTGPKVKQERREGVSLFGKNKRQRKDLPGSGTSKGRQSRPSEYAIQMRETQKLKRTYGVLERQFSNIIKDALKSTGNSGTRLLQLLELRLDNVVYKMNFAKSRMQARQLVTHGHVKVNAKKLDIPSFRVSIGDEIEIDADVLAGLNIEEIKKSEAGNEPKIAWLDRSSNSGKVLLIPQRAELDQGINERLIIEFYSR